MQVTRRKFVKISGATAAIKETLRFVRSTIPITIKIEQAQEWVFH